MNSLSNHLKRNIGIFAHVDAGKTTLTERMLFAAGAIRTVGRVDHGTSQTDSMEVERARGISVRAASTAVSWNGYEIRIIDTPGHADFYPEVERALRVLDGAVLVVSAVEGVQVQTLVIWKALRQLNVPTIIFINKLDRIGARTNDVISEITSMLSPDVIPLQTVIGAETRAPTISSILDGGNVAPSAVEKLADYDDAVLERFLRGGSVNAKQFVSSLAHFTCSGKVTPIIFGVAMQGIGVEALLDAICTYLPAPRGKVGNDLSAVVFKVESKSANGRMSHVRVFEGSLAQRTAIVIAAMEASEKATRILKMVPGRGFDTVPVLEAGDIGIVCGLQGTHVGDVLGASYAVPPLPTPVEPLLTARIFPELDGRWDALIEALRELEDEEPLLNVEWLEEQREINVRFFGEVQMEIILGLLKTRFSIDAKFSKPRVIFKETPKASARARVEHRTHGFADIELLVEPAAPGSGFLYDQTVRADKIYYKFIKQIPQVIDEARRRGPQGWEVTDLKVTLVDGLSRYDMGTKHADFKIVTPIALSRALADAGTDLLEPVMNFEVSVPEQYRAPIYRDLVKMRAVFNDPAPENGRLTFVGIVPFVEIFENTGVLYASSHGQGSIKTSFSGYQRVCS